MVWRIAALRVQNYLRVRDVEVTPGIDQNVVLIAGKNGHGKSSTLRALSRLLGGKREQAADPVHHGATKSVIAATLEDGKEHQLVVELEIKPGGASSLSITDEHGTPLKSPQTILDKIIGGRALDPLAFTQLPAKEQRATLLRLIDKEGEIAKIDVQRQRVFDNRTEVGRKEEHAKGELKRLPDRREVGEEIDPSALAEEQRAILEVRRNTEALWKDLEAVRETSKRERALAEREQATIERLERELEQARRNHDTYQRAAVEATGKVAAKEAVYTKAVAEWEAGLPRRTEIEAQLANANEHNRSVTEAVMMNKRRDEAEAVVSELSEQYENQTKLIAKHDARKVAILKAAKLPVDGLSVDDTGVLLNSAPFAQASSAEQLRVALALAIEAQPELKDVWIKDASLLDDESMKLVCEYAHAKDRTVWMEVVGTSHEGAVVITEGLSEGKVEP